MGEPWGRRLVRGTLVCVAMVVTAGIAGTPSAPAMSSVSHRTFVTDGHVNAVARSATTIYLGGFFTQVAPRTGPGVPLAATDGRPDLGMPQVSGGAAQVRAVAPDGSGGWYVGGSFTHVGEQPHANLAHLRADKSVDPGFAPSPDSAVDTLVAHGSTLYAGGEFTFIGGQSRGRLAALDASTGAAKAWQADADGAVKTLVRSGSTLYAGGEFTSLGGQPRPYLGAVRTPNASVTAWNPRPDDHVASLAAADGLVYAGGDFRSIGGQTRDHLAALDPATGAATMWDPAPSGPVYAVAVGERAVYVGGAFSAIGQQPRDDAGAVDKTFGQATPWAPHLAGRALLGNPRAGGFVSALAVDGSTVYIGGTGPFAAVDDTTGLVARWSVAPNIVATPAARTLAVSGSSVYVGGDFASLGGEARRDLAALDATTGELTPWKPDADCEVRALAASGTTVYAGGCFDHVGGQSRVGIAALDATAGTATAWQPVLGCATHCNLGVQTLVATPTTVYAGGGFEAGFERVNGQPRGQLAAIRASDGSTVPWGPGTPGDVTSLGLSGDTLYVGGRFASIGGQPRNNLAALNATDGTPAAWDPNADGGVGALAVAPGGASVYAGGRFTSIGGQPRSGLAELDAATGSATAWDPSPTAPVFGPEIDALAVVGDAVYAGGYFTSIGGAGHSVLAGVSRATGVATDFAPGPNGVVRAVAVAPDGSLAAGGDFTTTEQAPQSSIAIFGP